MHAASLHIGRSGGGGVRGERWGPIDMCFWRLWAHWGPLFGKVMPPLENFWTMIDHKASRVDSRPSYFHAQNTLGLALATTCPLSTAVAIGRFCSFV